MLPSLRGGEFVYVSEAAVAASPTVESSAPWLALVGDLLRLGAGGIIVPPTVAVPYQGLPVLAFDGDEMPGEVEGTLNRALTEFRGDLYRVGVELGRLLGVLSAAAADPPRFVREAATTIGLPIALTTAAGPLASTDPRQDQSPPLAWASIPLRDGLSLAVGWTEPRRAAVARLAADRLAEALAAAVRRSDAERPRGPARARGIERFLFGPAADDANRVRLEAMALGLSATSDYRLLIAPVATGGDIVRVVSPLATAIEAGAVDGDGAWLLEARSQRQGWSATVDRIAEALRPGGTGIKGWAALSAPATGFERLRDAAAEARMVAMLLRRERLPARSAAYGDARALGAWSVLLPLSRDVLRRFAEDTLRDLMSRDRRGELRRTLEVFLESGGATVEAARLLGIHRNTLAYRLRRIAALTGLDPLDPSTRLSLQLASMAWRFDEDSAEQS
jgi:hypothetical protein